MIRTILRFLYKAKIFKRIIPSLLKLSTRIYKKKIIIKHQNIFLSIDLMSPIDKELYLKNKYELEQITFFINEIEKNNIKNFVDVGAHSGLYSLLISKKGIFVDAFEPVNENYKNLLENKELNKIDNIKLHNKALSDKKEKVIMWVSNKNKTGGYSIYDSKDEELAKYNIDKLYKIESYTVIGDDILPFRNKKIAIKIDVERHEKNVLKGLKEVLLNNEVTIQVELFESKKKEIFDYLKSLNFKNFHRIEKDYYFKNY